MACPGGLSEPAENLHVVTPTPWKRCFQMNRQRLQEPLTVCFTL
jgi:hypothetical protein